MTAPVLDMNPEIRARWTAALRSGAFQQGRESLHQKDPDDGIERLCCLGVLCVLAERADVIASTFQEGALQWLYDGRVDYLPQSVRDWAGLTDSNPEILTADEGLKPLAWLNDANWSFARIADAIDGGTS